MSDVRLCEIWVPENPTNRTHELLREELYAAINSLDEFESKAARDMLAMFNSSAPRDGGYHQRLDEHGRLIRYSFKSEIV